jgi:hypothetical protein
MEDVAFPFHLYQYDPCPVATKKRPTRVVHDENADTQQVGESIQIVAGQRHANLHADKSSQRVEVSKLRNEIRVSRGQRRVPQHCENAVVGIGIGIGIGIGVSVVVRAAETLPLEKLGVGRDVLKRAEHEDLCGNQPVS